ncbi:nuclear transport factor 2 family protein [Rhizobium sp.]|jgi:hypothetical protein|uniref:nuclear transport factor 2 family protein n=1 Tax=Rhizobium sp. TaxID=391 RepID=UPI000E90A31C|nr:hypothetical protein [Rhizobium sp.]
MSNLHAEIRAAEDRQRAALVASDMVALPDLMEDDLVHVHTTGIVHGKEQLPCEWNGVSGTYCWMHKIPEFLGNGQNWEVRFHRDYVPQAKGNTSWGQ